MQHEALARHCTSRRNRGALREGRTSEEGAREDALEKVSHRPKGALARSPRVSPTQRVSEVPSYSHTPVIQALCIASMQSMRPVQTQQHRDPGHARALASSRNISCATCARTKTKRCAACEELNCRFGGRRDWATHQAHAQEADERGVGRRAAALVSACKVHICLWR